MLRYLLLAAFLLGCSDSHDSSDGGDAGPGSRPDAGPIFMACELSTYAWYEEVAEVQGALDHRCETDDDCVFAPGDLDCGPGGAYIGECQMVVSAENREAFQADLASAAAAFCAEVDPECRSAPLCLERRAVCRSELCTSE